MRADDARKLIRELVALGAFSFTESANDGMSSHGILPREVFYLVAVGGCVAQENGTWLFEGMTDASDFAVRVVVAVESYGVMEVRFVSVHLLLERG